MKMWICVLRNIQKESAEKENNSVKGNVMEKEKKKINYKRLISSLVGFPLIAVMLVFANTLWMDILLAVISMISLYEYYNCFKVTKKAKPSMWYGMLVSLLLAGVHFCSDVALKEIIIMLIPASILILTIEMVCSKNNKNIIDLVVTVFGICYITLMLLFISLVRANLSEGRILVWYIFIASWGSDVFAYLVGKSIGKHHFTKISPNKTIEGSIAGIIGAVAVALLYTLAVNNIYNLQIDYLMCGIITAILGFIGQIGDLAASAVKRYCGLKDFSELIPGHGGMLDRIDSVIFVAPFAYILLGLIV